MIEKFQGARAVDGFPFPYAAPTSVRICLFLSQEGVMNRRPATSEIRGLHGEPETIETLDRQNGVPGPRVTALYFPQGLLYAVCFPG